MAANGAAFTEALAFHHCPVESEDWAREAAPRNSRMREVEREKVVSDHRTVVRVHTD